MTEKLCICGCKKPVVLYDRTRKGRPKGQPSKFASIECYRTYKAANLKTHCELGHAKDLSTKRRVCRTCSRARRFARLYGIPVEKVFALEDPEFCHICGLDLGEEKRPCLDHDHDTGKLRGWLCNRCNAGLAMYDDDPIRIVQAAQYLLLQKKSTRRQADMLALWVMEVMGDV